MSSHEIDAYLDALGDPHRGTLRALRLTLQEILPDADEGLAYGVPVYRMAGRPVAGFAAFARHLTYLPHSGTVLAALDEEVADYRTSRGALRFPVDTPLPPRLVQLLVSARLAELEGS